MGLQEHDISRSWIITVLVLCISLTQHEGIMEQDDLSVDVFHHDEESLGSVVDFLVSLELWTGRSEEERVIGCT